MSKGKKWASTSIPTELYEAISLRAASENKSAMAWIRETLEKAIDPERATRAESMAWTRNEVVRLRSQVSELHWFLIGEAERGEDGKRRFPNGIRYENTLRAQSKQLEELNDLICTMKGGSPKASAAPKPASRSEAAQPSAGPKSETDPLIVWFENWKRSAGKAEIEKAEQAVAEEGMSAYFGRVGSGEESALAAVAIAEQAAVRGETNDFHRGMIDASGNERAAKLYRLLILGGSK